MAGGEQFARTTHVIFCPNYSPDQPSPSFLLPLGFLDLGVLFTLSGQEGFQASLVDALAFTAPTGASPGFTFPAHSLIFPFREVSFQKEGRDPPASSS